MNKFLLFISALLIAFGIDAQETKLTGTIIGVRPNNDNNVAEKAFDGDLNTFFRGDYYNSNYNRLWVGLDLGKEHVITKIGFAPRQDSDYAKKAVLSVFQGANNPDFSDAMPIAMVKEEYEKGKMHYIPVNVSMGFRYVRFMGASGVKGSVAELEFYGYEGVGDDSQFFQVTNLPTVAFNTPNMSEILSKEDKHPGSTVYVISEDGTRIFADYNCQMKGRGNASWNNPKKPFQIKLDKKRNILPDAPAKAKKWTLINNYGDKTLMRNMVSFEMSRLIGMPYTPYIRFVDVIYNGEYEGCYQLCDQVEVNPGRVNVTEIEIDETTHEPVDPNADISGGYLIEIDGYANNEPAGGWFTGNYASYSIPVTIKSPDDLTKASKPYLYIKAHFEKFLANVLSWQAANNVGMIEKYLDLDSFLKYVLVGELNGNTDTFWSTYMSKEVGSDKFVVGPVWDIDLGFNNDNRTYDINKRFIYDYLCLSDNVSYASNGFRDVVRRIIKENPDSRARLKEIWEDMRYNGNWTYGYFDEKIEEWVDEIYESQYLNFVRWPILSSSVHMNPGSRGSFRGEVNAIKEYLLARFVNLDKIIGIKSPSGIEDVVATPEPGVVKYYNLSGIEVSADDLTPGIYIKVDSTGSEKILVK